MSGGRAAPRFMSVWEWALTWLDDDAIMLSLASAVAAQVVTNFGGAAVGAGAISPEKTLTVTTGAHAATYVVGSVVQVDGFDGFSRPITGYATIANAGGGETLDVLVGGVVKGFSRVTTVTVPACTDALGTFKVGVKDVLPAEPFAAYEAITAGNHVFVTGDGRTVTLAMAAHELREVAVTKIVASTAVFGLRVFR